MTDHRRNPLCCECGELWPCPTALETMRPRCTALTARGTPCRKSQEYMRWSDPVDDPTFIPPPFCAAHRRQAENRAWDNNRLRPLPPKDSA